MTTNMEKCDYLQQLFEHQMAAKPVEKRPLRYTAPQVATLVNSGDKIGEGASGRVYTAQVGGQTVAIKMMKSIPEDDDINLLKDTGLLFFMLERCALMVDHENIIGFLGFCDDPNFLCLVLEYVPTVVSSIMKRISYRDALYVLLSTAKGLQATHVNNPSILHRDIKPHNVLYHQNQESGQRTGKVIDYGVSRVGDVETVNFGTETYQDPAEGAGHDASCDIYSWSMMAFAILAKESTIYRRTTQYVLNRLKQDDNVDPMFFAREIRHSGFTKEIGVKIFEFLVLCQSFDIASRPTIEEVVHFTEQLID